MPQPAHANRRPAR